MHCVYCCLDVMTNILVVLIIRTFEFCPLLVAAWDVAAPPCWAQLELHIVLSIPSPAHTTGRFPPE